MKDINEEEVFKLFGAKGTKEVLEFLDEHGKGQYIELGQFISYNTLNLRLRGLLSFGLISHHFERKPRKKEWYQLTEKGKQALQHLRALAEIHKLIGAKGTKFVLEFLDEHGKGQVIEMLEFMNPGTLNFRLQDLLRFGLINHCLERKPKKVEWYEITEKGKKALKDMRALIELTAGG